MMLRRYHKQEVKPVEEKRQSEAGGQERPQIKKKQTRRKKTQKVGD